MGEQLELTLPLKLTGRAALFLLPASTLKRARAQRGQFFIMGVDGSALTWNGRGKKPAWVAEYLNQGGQLADLDAHIHQP
ncbi:H-NS histone family protein [Chromobacterium alkanivorans]|uniref:H-NS family nucleoid-associated regulatory protein n=1 Tax=Chromobacterium alkanivorans TaxID=1071719 RepID=UPI001966EA47|nr:H-NS family nucleoid-associated regulatory protein [Chromobacterium alkanivorans]MBN3003380.1 H-NS histone family protein [Chromobacterium alkanivorans]